MATGWMEADCPWEKCPQLSELANLAVSSGLSPVGKRPKITSYLQSFFARRAFAFTLAKYSLLASTARSRLGVAWIVLVPALQVTLYGLIFGLILGDARPDNFLPFLIVGVVMFQFLSGSFIEGAKSITSNSSLVRSLDFPRILLPFSATASQFVRFAGILVIALLVLPFFGEFPTVSWLSVIGVIALAAIFSFGLSMLAARMTTDFSDLSQLIPFITRLMFYSSGVFFSIDKLTEAYSWLSFLTWANPISVYLELARASLVTGYSATGIDWLIGGLWAFLMLSTGFIFFWLAEVRYGRLN